MPKGRPKQSSPRSYQKLYTRLLKGPLWLEDWESTGLARSTVYDRLKCLEKKGLVRTREEGKKLLYELAPAQTDEGIVTHEGILWHSLLFSLSRKEKRHANAKTKRLVEPVISLANKLEKQKTIVKDILEEMEKLPESYTYKTLFEAMEEGGINWKNSTVGVLIKLWESYLSQAICIECLKKGKVRFLVWDYETGEVVCPEEGTVIRTELFRLKKPAKERPSPHAPPED